MYRQSRYLTLAFRLLLCNALIQSHFDYGCLICIANTVFKYWNGTAWGCIHEIFKPSLCRYSTRSQMALDIPLWKIITGEKSLFFLDSKIWSKINPIIKIVKTTFSLHVPKKNICKPKPIHMIATLL